MVLIDADTTIDPHLLRCFDIDLQAGQDWIQSHQTVANANPRWRDRLMTYSVSLVKGVVLLGQCALWGRAGLGGQGEGV